MANQNIRLSSISHELRNQIAPIFSLSEMIKNQFFGRIDDAKNKQEYLSAAEDIHNVAHDMLELLDDLMDMSANEMGDFSVKLEELEVADVLGLITRVIRLNRDFVAKKNIEIMLCKPEVTIPNKIKLDRRRIKQIFINLISNSIKYSKEGTKIIINVSYIPINKPQLVISIKDQGIGMTKQQIEMALNGQGTKIDKSALINHHYQTHNQEQTQIDSHGIGMPLVKKLVVLQQGTMDIKSKLGEGTEIILGFSY